MGDRRRELLTVPRPVGDRVLLAGRLAFFAAVGTVLVAGVTGRQVAAENFATVFTWPVWFRGLALLAVLVGVPWPALSPWRWLYRLLVRLEGDSVALLGGYPTRLHEWPAVVGFILLIGITENLTVVPRSPRLTAVIVAGYLQVMVAGGLLFGPTWFRRADPLDVFYRLFGRVAGLVVDRTETAHTLAVRPPWAGCLDPVRSLALVVFIIGMVYTVSFDGFTGTRPFQAVLFGVRQVAGTGALTSVLLYLLGLAAFVGLFVVASVLVERLGAGGGDWRMAARSFAPTVLPIAAAYEVAHNYPYVLRNVGQLVAVSTRWAVRGVQPPALLGWLSLPVFWGSQVVLVVVGHIVAVVAAHAVAASRYGSGLTARRGHLPLVVLMIGYTVLSLWIISQPVVR